MSVAAFGGSSILGPNDVALHSIPIANAAASVFTGHSGCTVSQRFLYAESDHQRQGGINTVSLLNSGNEQCPADGRSGGFCVKNSASVAAPDLKIADLAEMALEDKRPQKATTS